MGEVLLSKTRFLRGVRCQKALALDTLRPELRDPMDPASEMRLRLGQEVGRAARSRYPGGSVGRVPQSYAESVRRTKGLISGGEQIIYEATFQTDAVRIVADIHMRGQAGWRLIEVKSTTEPKPHHHWDVAVQVYTLHRSGMRLEDALLLHLNKDYKRRGELDFQALFTETSLFERAEALQNQVARQIELSRATLRSGAVPDIPIGPYCHDPYDCDFIGHCWKDVPSPSVFDVHFLGKRAFELFNQGVKRIEDIPPTFRLERRSRFHVQAHKVGERIVRHERLREFLGGLAYPLRYLDFETFALPIPPFDGLRPYEKVPFQYSLHVQGEPGGALDHSGFLAERRGDAREALLTRLLQETEGDGSILVYYSAFERGVLLSLAEQFPEHRAAILERVGRMVDLIVPFRRRWYWHPEMGGSNSLKDVLPVFAPELSYEETGIGDGEEAMAVFLSLRERTDPESIRELRQSLWDYCRLDTLAMVRILEGLRAAAGT
jgi:hypothetical protein